MIVLFKKGAVSISNDIIIHNTHHIILHTTQLVTGISESKINFKVDF